MDAEMKEKLIMRNEGRGNVDHDSARCALNRDIFFSGPGPGAGVSTGWCEPGDSRAKAEAGSTAGGRDGRRGGGNDGESTTAISAGAPAPAPAACCGGNDGESIITAELAASARGDGGWDCEVAGASPGCLRSNTDSRVGSARCGACPFGGGTTVPSRGSSTSAGVRGGASVRAVLNFESFFRWRAGAAA